MMHVAGPASPMLASEGAHLAYGERGENARLILRTVRNAANFRGRSRRSEVVYYWIAMSVIGIVTGFATFGVLPWGEGILVFEIARAALAVPLVALFSRRLHDQEKSGWWALLLAVAILLSVLDSLRWIQGDAAALLAYAQSGPHPLRWISAVVGISVMVLFLWPGTIGPNRFGPDPREAA